MTAGTTPVPERAGGASFELDRFELTSPDRLEIAGRWFGVRGLRFIRPALDLRSNGDRYRLLALLEHKPWAAEDGDEWVAAFPWDGDGLDLTQAELAVGPSLAVELPVSDAPAKPKRKSSSSKAKARVQAGVPSERAEAKLQELREERDAALAARDAALAERDAALAAREPAVAEHDALVGERDEALRERDRIQQDRDAAVAARDAAMAQVDDAIAERNEAVGERGAVLRARELAERERDELRKRLDEMPPDRPAAPPAPTPSRAPSAWTSRAVVLGAFAIVVIWVAAAVIRVLI
jgi:hypothetical protein